MFRHLPIIGHLQRGDGPHCQLTSACTVCIYWYAISTSPYLHICIYVYIINILYIHTLHIIICPYMLHAKLEVLNCYLNFQFALSLMCLVRPPPLHWTVPKGSQLPRSRDLLPACHWVVPNPLQRLKPDVDRTLPQCPWARCHLEAAPWPRLQVLG